MMTLPYYEYEAIAFEEANLKEEMAKKHGLIYN